MSVNEQVDKYYGRATGINLKNDRLTKHDELESNKYHNKHIYNIIQRDSYRQHNVFLKRELEYSNGENAPYQRPFATRKRYAHLTKKTVTASPLCKSQSPPPEQLNEDGEQEREQWRPNLASQSHTSNIPKSTNPLERLALTDDDLPDITVTSQQQQQQQQSHFILSKKIRQSFSKLSPIKHNYYADKTSISSKPSDKEVRQNIISGKIQCANKDYQQCKLAHDDIIRIQLVDYIQTRKSFIKTTSPATFSQLTFYQHIAMIELHDQKDFPLDFEIKFFKPEQIPLLQIGLIVQIYKKLVGSSEKTRLIYASHINRNLKENKNNIIKVSLVKHAFKHASS
ncbi:unnamed protein product [Didymodactylos carnosus]|uniref:Uncharacterized protein n=1 Tax=Didymodactylos carnosus TaxID=1234261 RepID=A0A814GNY0_9BILA|nr:unnamed protein product [Didymodactylos carnosus]CAF0998903.1 unnamed protein product [Didymodactylos carnosus]CAF3647736.1 unnamed protein product [Didymodactylos carnosus]CAF3770390.1 unnamed protein product [Didymodactylos carnosus]